jgi:hypothetical protein
MENVLPWVAAMSSKREDDSSEKRQVNPDVDYLSEYLKYYKSLSNPGYAVLVVGEWGCGKTYQVNASISEDERHYLSLFGLKSASEIEGALFAKMYPERANANAVARWAKDKSIGVLGVSLPVGGLLSAAIDATVRDKVDTSKLIVLDDLERSAVDQSVLLGVINRYVEHHGCRVVVIAHDEKILGNFREAKEKVFGHTVRVKSKTVEAFRSFLVDIDERARKLVVAHEELLLEVIRLSGCASLRVIRHMLKNIERLTTLLTEQQISRSEAIERLLALFAAVSIEVLRGDLQAPDLINRIASYTIAISKNSNLGKINEESNSIPIVRSRKRYVPLVDILSLQLSDEVLVAMVIDGHYDYEELQTDFVKSALFADPTHRPAWWRFINFDNIEDDIVAQAAMEMDRQFLRRELSNLGDLMHVFTLRLMRSKNGLVADSKDKILADSKSYLDDLVSDGRFPLEPEYDYFGNHPAYGGHMFWIDETDLDFLKQLRDHVRECEKRVLEKAVPEFKTKLLDALKSSPEEFAKLITYVDGEQGEYQTIPVLNSVPVSEFTDAFLKLPVASWRSIYRALQKRKDLASRDNSLSVEIDWFRNLKVEMSKRADLEKGQINSLRISRHIP